MASKLNIAIGAVFAASLFAASAVNAASLEEQLALSDGFSGGTASEARGPAGRPAESTGGVSAELQAQLSLSDGGPTAFPESETGPQGRPAGGASEIDKHLEAQLKISDGMPQ